MRLFGGFLLTYDVSCSILESMQTNLPSPSDVVGSMFLSERQADLYKDHFGIKPNPKFVRAFESVGDELEDEKFNNTLSRTFRADVQKWKHQKK